MNEKEIVHSYLTGKLPPGIQVVKVLAEKTGYNDTRVYRDDNSYASRFLTPESASRESVSLRRFDFDDFEGEVWAAYAPVTSSLVIAEITN